MRVTKCRTKSVMIGQVQILRHLCVHLVSTPCLSLLSLWTKYIKPRYNPAHVPALDPTGRIDEVRVHFGQGVSSAILEFP